MKKECFDYSSDYKFFLIKEILNAVINDYTIINNYDCNKEFSASDIYEMQILDNHLKLNMHAKSRDNKIYDILTISMELDFKMIFGLVFGINGSCEVMGQSGPIKYQIDYLKALGNVDKIDDGSTFFLLITKDKDYNNSIRRIYKYNHWQLTREKDAEKSMGGVVIPYQDQESISKIMISRLRDYLKQDEETNDFQDNSNSSTCEEKKAAYGGIIRNSFPINPINPITEGIHYDYEAVLGIYEQEKSYEPINKPTDETLVKVAHEINNEGVYKPENEEKPKDLKGIMKIFGKKESNKH